MPRKKAITALKYVGLVTSGVILVSSWLSTQYRNQLIFTLMFTLFLWVLRDLDTGKSTARESRLIFLGLLLVGGALRFAWATLVPTLPVSDFTAHHENALNLAQGIAVSGKDLGYTLLLAMGYRLSAALLTGKLINAIASTLSLACIYIIGCKLAGPKTGWMAALLYAIYPSEINMVSVLGSEVLATSAALAVAALFILGAGGKPDRKHIFAIFGAGFFYGLGLMIKISLLFYFPVILLGILFLVNFQFIQKAWLTGSFLAGLAAGLGTVVMAYSLMVGQFSTATLKMRDSAPFLVGTNISHHGQYSLEDENLYWSWPPNERDRFARQEALRRVLSDPVGFLKIIPAKMKILIASNNYSTIWSMEAVDWGTGNMWGVKSNGGENWTKYRDRKYDWTKTSFYAAQVAYSVVWFFAFYALLKKEMSPLSLLALGVLLSTLLPHIVLEVQGRYHHVVMPFITLLAAYGLSKQPDGSDQAGTHRAEGYH